MSAIRPRLYVLWFISGLLALLLVLAISVWFMIPREQPILVANLSELRIGEPNYHPLRSDIAIFLVRSEESVIAWDATSAITNCRIRWVQAKNRFEDPCCGGKWCIDGSIADPRYRDVRTLSHYEVEVDRQGAVWLYPFRRVEGELISPDEWQNSDRIPPDEVYYCNR